MRTVATIFLALWVLTSALGAGEQEQPVVEVVEPELQTVFDDAFEGSVGDFFRRYKPLTDGSSGLAYSPGVLNLRVDPGASQTLVRPCAFGAVSCLTAEIDFPPLETAGQSMETRLGLVMVSRQLVLVAFARERAADGLSGKIRLLRVKEDASQDLIREFTLTGDLPSGQWVIRYHHGYVRVMHEGKPMAQGHAEVQPSTVPSMGVTMFHVAGSVTYRHLRLDALGPPSPPETEEGKAALGDAVCANKRCLELYRGGQLNDAAAAATEAVGLFSKARGANHPDVAGAIFNLGFVTAAKGEKERARHIYQRALEARQEIFGDGHPETARVRAELGGLLVAQGWGALAKTHFETAYPVYEQVYGQDHARTQTLHKLIKLLTTSEQSQEAP